MNELERLDKLEGELNAVKLELARYKGFMGGIVAIVMAIVGLVEIVLPFVRKH